VQLLPLMVAFVSREPLQSLKEKGAVLANHVTVSDREFRKEYRVVAVCFLGMEMKVTMLLEGRG